MTPFWEDDHLTLYGGDCREVLRELPAESVHCVVTSPPYWGLRDYGTASWDGGDPECDHNAKSPEIDQRTSTLGPNRTGLALDNAAYQQGKAFKVTCGKCGARRIDSQLGLEATPEEFVANMVAVFREVRRVLRKDGTLWLNLGDSYASGEVGRHDRSNGYEGEFQRATRQGERKQARLSSGLKPKDLVGIPWRVAFALQADGWYLRSDIIWAKPNPMPESVTDRPTKAHEYLFLLTRSPRYYYDAEAVREDARYGFSEMTGADRTREKWAASNGNATTDPTRQPITVTPGNGGSRNLRSVWNIATEPYPGAHFATFPRKLVEPCVKAGTSERGVCPECGAPWVRVVEREGGKSYAVEKSATKRAAGLATAFSGYDDGSSAPTFTTIGWRASCTHEAEPVPGVVLDPFAGSGTTLFVAQALGRRGVGIDLSPDYLKQALERNRQTPLGLVG